MPCPIPGDLPNPGMEPNARSLALQADSLTSEPPGKLKNTGAGSLSLLQGIFLTQVSKWGLLHCRQILYQLSYQATGSLQKLHRSMQSVWIHRNAQSKNKTKHHLQLHSPERDHQSGQCSSYSHCSHTWDPTIHTALQPASNIPRRGQWHPTPVLLPGKSHGWRSLVGCSPWGR